MKQVNISAMRYHQQKKKNLQEFEELLIYQISLFKFNLTISNNNEL